MRFFATKWSLDKGSRHECVSLQLTVIWILEDLCVFLCNLAGIWIKEFSVFLCNLTGIWIIGYVFPCN